MFVFGLKLFLALALLLVLLPMAVVIGRAAFDPNQQTEENLVPLVLRCLLCFILSSLVLAVAFSWSYTRIAKVWQARWECFDEAGRRLVESQAAAQGTLRLYRRSAAEGDPLWAQWRSLPRLVRNQLPQPRREVAPGPPLSPLVQTTLRPMEGPAADGLEIVLSNRVCWRMEAPALSMATAGFQLAGVDAVVFEQYPTSDGSVGLARLLSLEGGVRQLGLAVSVNCLPELQSAGPEQDSVLVVRESEGMGGARADRGRSVMLRWHEGRLRRVP